MSDAETEADSFQVRVKNAVNGPYQNCMRRSLQSLALYEADRCIKDRYSKLRPFQRKFALLATSNDLLGSLDFLNDYTRQEIMFRTNASKEPLSPELAWRRMKIIDRDIAQTILPIAKQFVEDDENSEKSHDEICEMLLQSMYEESSGNTKPHPPQWEWNHNNLFTVYRVYYRGVSQDPNIFTASPPKVVDVPSKKPENMEQPKNVKGNNLSTSLAKMNIYTEMSDEERRAMLKEVKDHTELLKQFEGVIPEEELSMRKRALYAALPPVPPPLAQGKRQKRKAKAAANTAGMAVAATPTKSGGAGKTEEEDDGDWAKLDCDDPKIEQFAHV